MESGLALELRRSKMCGFVVVLQRRLVHRRDMSALGCVLGSRSAKLHVPAAQHMHPGNNTWGGDRSLESAVTDSTEQLLHRATVEGQLVPAET